MNRVPTVLSADTMIGDDVKNPDGEDLGNVEALMIDVNRGRIVYAVLSFGGFLGIGDKLFAIPWESLTLDRENECFILDVDEDTLEDAPGFDKDDWPATVPEDDEWLVSVYTHYHHKPYWQ